ncbi:MAG: sensor histidine kinase [Chloroflexota bacterium]|nr:sensor histidine kinase [Chloroflexota bacterium]
MASQFQGKSAGYSTKTEWLILRAGDIAVYVTLVLGYFFSLMTADILTPLNFLAFTVVQILYALVAWWMLRKVEIPRWQRVLGMVSFATLTFISGMLAVTGIGLDWLLYFATVGAYIYLLSTRTALLAVLLLYLVVLVNLGFLGGWNRVIPSSLSLLAGFGFVVVFSYSNRLLTVERERSKRLLRQLEASNRELEDAHKQLQKYANEVEELTVNRERTRMAREIHDTLGHYLTILSIQLETISKLQERDPDRAVAEVAEARRVAAQSMQEVRNAVAALRPTSIATLSLTEALTQLGSEFERVAQETELTLDLDTPLPQLSHELQLALYRTAQEALTNVRKHTHATKVLLRLRYEHEILELIVLDNGTGASQNASEQSTRGFGLIGLRERAELLGGEVCYEPTKPTGYRVTIRIPVPLTSTTRTSDLVVTQGE